MPFRVFAVLVLGLVWFGCESEVDPDVDTITIGTAAAGDLIAVLNGSEEVRKKVVHVTYDKVYERFHFYVEFENGVYLNMDCPLRDAIKANDLPDSSLSAYIWDSRKVDFTPLPLALDYVGSIVLTIDSITKKVSGMFNCRTDFPKEEWSSRLSQGTFTDIPYIEQPGSEYSYTFSMTDNGWIEPSDWFTKHDVLFRPTGELNLSFDLISTVNDSMRYARVHFTLIDSLLTLGEHDLNSIRGMFCDATDLNERRYFPKDSLIHGKLIVSALDRNARRISGSYNFSMRDKDGKSFDVSGMFADQYWLEYVRTY